jgi:leader peptidase (prepilin peptidase)/N-methyltransferase
MSTLFIALGALSRYNKNMEFIFYALMFLFGTAIGSFLNVVIFRHNTGMTLLGRSFCFSCRKELLWHDLMPLMSFLLLRGKCRFCKSKISGQYAAVEAVAGAVFALVLWKAGGVQFLDAAFLQPGGFVHFLDISFSFVLWSILIIIGVYDLRHKIIPDFFAYSFAALALTKLVFLPQTFLFTPSLWDFLAGPILALPFALLWLVSRGRWMGFGDAKLTLGLGWFLGIQAGFVALILAFWIGSLVGVALILIGKLMRSSLFSKRVTMKSEIPFAPFLILGLFLAYFFPGLSNFIAGLFI